MPVVGLCVACWGQAEHSFVLGTPNHNLLRPYVHIPAPFCFKHSAVILFLLYSVYSSSPVLCCGVDTFYYIPNLPSLTSLLLVTYILSLRRHFYCTAKRAPHCVTTPNKPRHQTSFLSPYLLVYLYLSSASFGCFFVEPLTIYFVLLQSASMVQAWTTFDYGIHASLLISYSGLFSADLDKVRGPIQGDWKHALMKHGGLAT